jgi:hypothetical protein
MVMRGQGANRVANLQRKRPELLRDHSGSQVFELLITGRVHMCVMVSGTYRLKKPFAKRNMILHAKHK